MLLASCASPVFRLVSRTSLLVIGLMMILSSSGSLLPALSLPHQSGFFSSVMWSSLTASVSTNGPVPALKALRVKSSPAASTTLRETIMPARSTSSDSSGENGVVRLKRTVDGSTTSTLATGASSPLRAERIGGAVAVDVPLDRRRRRRAMPSWYLTSLRSVKVTCLPSAEVSHLSASQGMILPVWSTRTSES